jgi:uncharacterized protein YggE
LTESASGAATAAAAKKTRARDLREVMGAMKDRGVGNEEDLKSKRVFLWSLGR